jgi:outer membrane cobalamin receptor
MQLVSYRLSAAAAALAVTFSAFGQSPPSTPTSTSIGTDAAKTPNEASAGELKLGPTPQLATVVVTPGRTAEPLGETLGDNSVISRDELDTLPNGTLADALVREHSIEALNYGGPQSQSSINIRGTNSNQSLILIDGLRINSATSGNAPLNAIPLNSIERVEIVRGTASSLYGADAIGGVVNVITRGDQDRPFQPTPTQASAAMPPRSTTPVFQVRLTVGRTACLAAMGRAAAPTPPSLAIILITPIKTLTTAATSEAP